MDIASQVRVGHRVGFMTDSRGRRASRVASSIALRESL